MCTTLRCKSERCRKSCMFVDEPFSKIDGFSTESKVCIPFDWQLRPGTAPFMPARFRSLPYSVITAPGAAFDGSIRRLASLSLSLMCVLQNKRFSGGTRSMKSKVVITSLFTLCLCLATIACSKQSQTNYKDSVKTAIEQADMKDVTV